MISNLHTSIERQKTPLYDLKHIITIFLQVIYYFTLAKIKSENTKTFIVEHMWKVLLNSVAISKSYERLLKPWCSRWPLIYENMLKVILYVISRRVNFE